MLKQYDRYYSLGTRFMGEKIVFVFVKKTSLHG